MVCLSGDLQGFQEWVERILQLHHLLALLHESLNGADRVHLSEVGALFDGYRYRLAELAKAIEDGATQLSFSLLTIGSFCV